MKTSEQIDTIIPALVECQRHFKEMTKDTKGFNYKYATLDQLLAMARPVFNDNNIVLMQEVSSDVVPMEATQYGFVQVAIVSTHLYHASGQFLISDDMVSAVQPEKQLSLMQSEGKAITYSRRYQLQALMGITAEEDNDAAATDPRRDAQRQVATSREEAVRDIRAGRGYPRRGDPDHGVSEAEEARETYSQDIPY